MGERPTPDAPHPGRGRPPRAPSCRPHSAQDQLARARLVGLVTGSRARTPPPPQPVGSGPRTRPKRTSGRGLGERPTRTPHTQARGATPGRPHAAPTARKSARCGVGDGSPRPHPQHPQPVASEPQQPGEGERLTPGAPHKGGRHPPRGRPSATPTARNSGPQGRVPSGRCRFPTPAPTAPGTHGSRNPGCPLQRTGGRERDSA